MTFRYWANAQSRSNTRWECPVKGCPVVLVATTGLPPECPGHGRQMRPAADQRGLA